MPVFTDASSAILLEKAKLFTAFSRTFRLVLAASVFHEISRPGYSGAAFFMKAFADNIFDVVSVSEHMCPGLPQKNKMGAGERDILCLFLEQKQGFILTDDGRAAALCRDHGLPFINALLVPKIMAYAGLMTRADCSDRMVYLCRIGRYSQKIKDLAFSFTKKDLTLFIPENKNEAPLF